MGRKVQLLPQSKLDQVRNVRKTAVFDIVLPVKSKQDQKMEPLFDALVSPDKSPAEAFDIGYLAGYSVGWREAETQFWQIVDRDGPSGLPSDMFEALGILAQVWTGTGDNL